MSLLLYNRIVEELDTDFTPLSTEMGYNQVNLAMPNPQMRIASNLKVRTWLFNKGMGSLEGNISVLRIGRLVMMGMPCDFSGEIYVDNNLEKLFREKDLSCMITSFNGD